MKILAVSDIHARWLDFPPERMPPADLALVAGDLTDGGYRGDLAEIKRAECWLSEMARRYATVYWIPGNHDVGIGPETFHLPSNVTCVLERTLPLPTMGSASHLTLRGVCLCPAYDLPELATRYGYTTIDPAVEAAAYDFEGVDIVLSHCPPWGTLDFWADARDALGPRHIGSHGLEDYIHKHHPQFVVCGHVHGAAGQAILGKTRIWNVAEKWEVLEL